MILLETVAADPRVILLEMVAADLRVRRWPARLDLGGEEWRQRCAREDGDGGAPGQLAALAVGAGLDPTAREEARCPRRRGGAPAVGERGRGGGRPAVREGESGERRCRKVGEKGNGDTRRSKSGERCTTLY